MVGIPGVPDALARTLSAHGYDVLTPVQRAVLDAAPGAPDLLVSAPTGSGKTLAFGLALAAGLLGGAGQAGPGGPRALVIVPTRELAQQVTGELGWLYDGVGLRLVCCTGGMDMRAERRALGAGCALVVGTPGRLRDHVERGFLETSGVVSVVVDEADDILDMGFRDDLEFLMAAAGPERQTVMVSATLGPATLALAARYQRDAVRVDAGGVEAVATAVRHEGIAIAPNDRETAIVNILRIRDAGSALVFCATREAVGHLASRLDNRGFNVVSLSGALPQKSRGAAMAAMRDGRARVCVATDLAARGIDLPRLDLVIQADLPASAAALVHRAGRTGRAGRPGLSVLLVAHTERRQAERLIRQAGLVLDWVEAPGPEDVRRADEARMMTGPELHDATTAEEGAAAQRLLAAFPAEAIAVAYLRRVGSALPAPELLLGQPVGAPRLRRARILDGIWFRLNCGAADEADVRWVLPLICRLGHVTKRDVGRIHVRETETLFEISAARVAAFEAALARHREAGVEIRRGDPGQTVAETA